MLDFLEGAWRTLLEPAGLAIENALLLQRAEALSVTDDLTRLYNSRFLNLSLRRDLRIVLLTFAAVIYGRGAF